MQEPACSRPIGKLTLSTSLSTFPLSLPSLVAVLLLLSLSELPVTRGSCMFPSSWAGEWYQSSGSTPISINSTNLGEKTCVERKKDKYIVYSETCYTCMIINRRHENLIQYREGWCDKHQTNLETLCQITITSDDLLYSMFRMNAKPIPCPFSGPPFTFSYNRGNEECSVPESRAERCTDESKLLLKYQACPDVDGTESNTEELQCLAVWNDGRNKYLVGTLKGRTALGSDKTYRCFLYQEETTPHHQGKVAYRIAQSGDATCNGLTTVSEGSPTITLTKADKEHGRCKYPSWVTQHHDWHSLDGTKTYHITNKNATLKVRILEGSDGSRNFHRASGDAGSKGGNESDDNNGNGDGTRHDTGNVIGNVIGNGIINGNVRANDDSSNEEKIVCHNLEKLYPNDNMQGHKVKLVAHVTSGCDIGYVCMIFHRRDGHVIELQQSDQKAIMPEEACSIRDPSTMPYTTLITSFLHQRRCPQSGRYGILNPPSSSVWPAAVKRQRRSERTSNTVKRRTWPDDSIEEEECRSTDVQIGCSSSEQNEIIISNTCEDEGIEYLCHGSWEEKGTWYTIVSRRSSKLSTGVEQTFCFALHPLSGTADRFSERNSRSKVQEQEFSLSTSSQLCQRDATNVVVYRLFSRGVCEDATKAASGATFSSPSRSTFILFVGSIGSLVTVCR